MNQSFRNVQRVFLTAIELPIGFVNIRTGSTDTLQFTLNNVKYTTILPEKQYNVISALVADLNLVCIGVVPNVVITFSISNSLTLPLRLIITFSGSTVTTSFNIIDTNLSKFILGFRSGIDSLANMVYAASYSNYNLNPDSYVLMYIPTLNGLNSTMGGGAISTFKIPLNTVANQIYFYQEGISFKQSIETNSSNLTLSDLTVIIYDKYGKNLNPKGYDYSFSLTVEYLG
jgi:hypothetical protein